MDFFELLKQREQQQKLKNDLQKKLENDVQAALRGGFHNPQATLKDRQKHINEHHPDQPNNPKAGEGVKKSTNQPNGSKDPKNPKPFKPWEQAFQQPQQSQDKLAQHQNDADEDPAKPHHQQSQLDETKIAKNLQTPKNLKQPSRRMRGIEKAFTEADEIQTLTQTFDATYLWMLSTKLLNNIPDCLQCNRPLQLVLARDNSSHDGRWYICKSCKLRTSLRYNSFCSEFKCTLMELCRVIFCYYCRGYTVESAQRELVGSMVQISKAAMKNVLQMILAMYAFCRQMVSERVIKELREQKLGGEGMQVWLDTYKLNLRTNSGVDEFWIIGILQPDTNRCRCYLTTDLRIDTIALFIAKTVKKNSILHSPYYHQHGWVFLDKFYDHQRLRKDQLNRNKSSSAGFTFMWKQIKELELVFMKLGEKTKRLQRIKSHLQTYLDELCWRCEYRTLSAKRKFMIETLQTDKWLKYRAAIKKQQQKALAKEGYNKKGVSKSNNQVGKTGLDGQTGNNDDEHKNAQDDNDCVEQQQTDKNKQVNNNHQDDDAVQNMFDKVMLQKRKLSEKDKNQKSKLVDKQGEPTKKRRKVDNPADLLPEDDPLEERRRCFGQDSQENSQYNSQQSNTQESQDEDEFLIVLEAVKERKRFEAELNRPMGLEKLSQTGWKLKNNFKIKPHHMNQMMDDKDRIDVFAEYQHQVEKNLAKNQKSNNGKNGLVSHDGRYAKIVSQNSYAPTQKEDCVILEY